MGLMRRKKREVGTMSPGPNQSWTIALSPPSEIENREPNQEGFLFSRWFEFSNGRYFRLFEFLTFRFFKFLLCLSIMFLEI